MRKEKSLVPHLVSNELVTSLFELQNPEPFLAKSWGGKQLFAITKISDFMLSFNYNEERFFI